jgi:hypothetical protein
VSGEIGGRSEGSSFLVMMTSSVSPFALSAKRSVNPAQEVVVVRAPERASPTTSRNVPRSLPSPLSPYSGARSCPCCDAARPTPHKYAWSQSPVLARNEWLRASQQATLTQDRKRTSATLVLAATLLPLNAAIALDLKIVKDNPTPSRATGRRSASRMGGTIRHPT